MLTQGIRGKVYLSHILHWPPFLDDLAIKVVLPAASFESQVLRALTTGSPRASLIGVAEAVPVLPVPLVTPACDMFELSLHGTHLTSYTAVYPQQLVQHAEVKLAGSR